MHVGVGCLVRSQRAGPGSGQRWGNGEHAATRRGGGPGRTLWKDEVVVLPLLGEDPTCNTNIYQLWVLFNVIVIHPGKHGGNMGKYLPSQTHPDLPFDIWLYDICMGICCFFDLNSSILWFLHSPIDENGEILEPKCNHRKVGWA